MTDTADDVLRIEEALRRIEEAENSANPQAIVALLTEDAVIMAPNYPVQAGKPACAEFVTSVLADVFDHFDRHISYSSSEIQVFGDRAFDRGEFWFTVAPRTGGAASRSTGKYLFLYARVAGAWKLARAIVSVDNPDEETENVP